MRCEEVRENLTAFLDDEIGGAARRAVDDHLASCPACAAERDAQSAAWALLDRYPAPPVPAGFDARVLARLRGDGGARPAGRLFRLPIPAVAAAAGLLAVAGGAWVLLRGRGEAEPPPGEAEPPSEILENLAVLEAWDSLQDRDLQALDDVDDLAEEDLAVLGG